jgi:hypothetical protein
MVVCVRYSEVIDPHGTIIVTSQRLTHFDPGWNVGDIVEIPLLNGGKARASISGIRYISGAGVGPEGTYLSLEFTGAFLKNVERGGEVVNLGPSR